MRSHTPLPALLVCVFALACNPGDFDAALDKAPVVSVDNGGAGSPFVLPLASPPSGGHVAGRVLVSRRDTGSLAVAEYDKAGKASLRRASDADMVTLGNSPANSAAMLGPGDTILLGLPRFGSVGSAPPPGGVALLTLATAADGTASFTIVPTATGPDPGDYHVGLSVAGGHVTDPNGRGEFVAVSDNGVYLIGVDGARLAATDCMGPLGDANQGPYGFRPVAVGDLFSGGGDEIALGTPGRVVFAAYDAASKSLQCLSTATLTGGATFGSALAVGDFDADGYLDLAVGAPPSVRVYFGPLDSSTDVLTINSAGSTALGKRLAAFPLPVQANGHAKAGLMVADPMATVGGRAGAGKVMLLQVQSRTGVVDAAGLVSATLFDSASDSPTGVFGDDLGFMQLDATVCGHGLLPVPWATSGASVLTYFNYPGGGGDPRCSAP